MYILDTHWLTGVAFEMQYAALGLLLFPFRSMASAFVYTVFVGKFKT